MSVKLPLSLWEAPVSDAESENDSAMAAGARLQTDEGKLLVAIRATTGLTQAELAQLLGTSLVSVVRWERGDNQPGREMAAAIKDLHKQTLSGQRPELKRAAALHTFASRGVRERGKSLPLFDKESEIKLLNSAQKDLISRLKRRNMWTESEKLLPDVFVKHSDSSKTLNEASSGGISAGKNTYTYDAHTYHTKVPPQGIAEVIRQYLPEGGLVLDPFSGSGMTGVAALSAGYDVILNELSPAASFISNRFTRKIDPRVFAAGVRAVCEAVEPLRKELYSTDCRECGKTTEILHTVWSYNVICPSCNKDFLLWDHCRKYGKTVKDHKILKQFPCPCCGVEIKKSRLSRTNSEPVLVGYKCCSKVQVEHPPNKKDLSRLAHIESESFLASGFYPTTPLPAGVNLGQPKRHGLTTIDRFYTPRNLAAMSHIWKAIHRIDDAELAGFLAFAFTSLYQRVTRMSEFRFWGGSGNTANFNVPYISNEANVFVTFERKARSIQDHLESTAQSYNGTAAVRTGSATDLDFIPDNSIDLIFTDPPFGSNINYSEMNILWESWLGEFTDNTNEAIVNKVQGKDTARYGQLMLSSLRECHRVLRPGHWMMLVFMNSSQEIWDEIRNSVVNSGFSIEKIDIFDKQHGTFKQYVSENTAGCDLILHCRKISEVNSIYSNKKDLNDAKSISDFIKNRVGNLPSLPYLHVRREEEVDYRMLYSEWLSEVLIQNKHVMDFSSFKKLASLFIEKQ